MVFNAMSELRPSSRRELVSASNSHVMGKKMISSIMGWSILRCSSACRHGLVWFRGLTPQQQPGSYQGGEMMMKSVFWWRKPEHPEETTDLRLVGMTWSR